MATKKKLLQAAAGQAGGAGLNVEEVFSTYLYEGNGTTQTITNGIDLDGEGGLVWIKNRDFSDNHMLLDTERGNEYLVSNENFGAAGTGTSFVTTSTGFNIVGSSFDDWNASGENYASWTFRKAPKFFDVVTYTGDGTTGRQISHNLDHTVGCMIIKKRSASGYWGVYHRSTDSTAPEDYVLLLNSTSAKIDEQFFINDTAPTSTHFTVGAAAASGGDFNTNGSTYVAYLFAHNDGDGEFGPTGDQDIIKCGSYTGNGSSTGPVIDLGFEPQWILTKRTDSTSQWSLLDNMRGMPVGGSDVRLYPNLTNADDPFALVDVTPTGFNVATSGSAYNASGGTFIYIAIRRGPMAVPESATDVFHVEEKTNPNSFVTSNFVTDFAWHKRTSATDGHYAFTRLTGERKYLQINSNLVEGSTSDSTYFTTFDHMDGVDFNLYGSSSNDTIFYMFKRAPKFFDVVTYRGDGAYGQTPHNLGVAPELMISRGRANTYGWHVVHTLASSNNAGPKLDDTSFGSTYANISNFTATHFPKMLSFSGEDHVAYLFASLPGVSKVGTYTGTGASQTIDCGFSAGARFVLIKCTTQNSTPWLLFDSARGITTAVNPHLRLNSTDAQASQDANDIEPDNSGFIVNSVNNTNNGNGESYIFYAIA